jgi:hypothetical protein
MYIIRNFKTENLIKKGDCYVFDSKKYDSFSIIIDSISEAFYPALSSMSLNIVGIDEDIFENISMEPETTDVSSNKKKLYRKLENIQALAQWINKPYSQTIHPDIMKKKITYCPISQLRSSGSDLKSIFSLKIFFMEDKLKPPIIYQKIIEDTTLENTIVPFQSPADFSKAKYLIVLFDISVLNPPLMYPVFIDSTYRFFKLNELYRYKNIFAFKISEKLTNIVYFACILTEESRINSIFLTYSDIIDDKFVKDKVRFNYGHLVDLGKFLEVDKKIKNLSSLPAPYVSIHNLFSLNVISKTFFNVMEKDNFIEIDHNTVAFIRYKLLYPVENLSIYLSEWNYNFDFFITTENTKFTPGIIQRIKESGHSHVDTEEAIVEVKQDEILFSIKGFVTYFSIYFITSRRKVRIDKRQIKISYLNYD